MSRARHFPLFLDLEGKPCLVVGGGPVALRKAQALESFGARVTIVGGTGVPPVRRRTGANGQDARSTGEYVGRNFVDADVEGKTLVVSATDDRATNARVASLCKRRGIPVNVVDDPANCTFFFPAIARKGPLTVAVSSGGACPVAAKMVRDKAARLLTDDFVSEVEQLGRRREELKKQYPDPQERRRVCEEALAKWNG